MTAQSRRVSAAGAVFYLRYALYVSVVVKGKAF